MKKIEAIPPLSALAQPVRLDMFMTIAKHDEGISASDVAAASKVHLSTASAHLTILRNAGLVTSQRDGRTIIYSPVKRRLRDVIDFLSAIAS